MHRFFRSSEKFTPNPLYPGLKPGEHGDSGPWQTGYTYCAETSKQSIVAMGEVCTPHVIRQTDFTQ
jgi:hypothetical protein